MIFMHGIYFALTGDHEHWNLRFEPAQVQVVDHPSEIAYIHYTEYISKNNPGGLKGRENKPKVVLQYENLENPTRCFDNYFACIKTNILQHNQMIAFILDPSRIQQDTVGMLLVL